MADGILTPCNVACGSGIQARGNIYEGGGGQTRRYERDAEGREGGV